MSGLETNLKNTRPRPHHLETETKTTSTRSRPRRDRDHKKSVSRPASLASLVKKLKFCQILHTKPLVLLIFETFSAPLNTSKYFIFII